MIHLPFPCNSSLPDLRPSHLEEWEAACVWLLPSSASADGRIGQTGSPCWHSSWEDVDGGVSFLLSHHFHKKRKKKVETWCLWELLSVCHTGMKLAKGINVLWALPTGRGEAAAETELKYERTERHSSGNHFHFTNYPSLQKTDWRETLGLNLVAHPFPAAHWYNFFDQIENHRSFSMQTPWRMLPCTRNCWNLCSWLRKWAAPQSLETKVKGAAFTPGTEQPGLVFHTSATSKCHSVATWQGCVSTGICYLSFQGWAGHFLTDNPTGPDKWLNKLGLGGFFSLFCSNT